MWERIEELMKEKHCRMADVAKGSGVSYSTLTDWKAGRYTPKIEKIIKIAQFFDVSPAYILGNIDDPHGQIDDSTVIFIGTPEGSREEYIKNAVESVEKYYANNKKPEPSYDAEQIAKALELYEKYQKAIPQVQAAVVTLLKEPQSDV